MNTLDTIESYTLNEYIALYMNYISTQLLWKERSLKKKIPKSLLIVRHTWGLFLKLPTSNSWQNKVSVMFQYHMTEDCLRYNLKNPCLRLWTEAKHHNYICNLYTFRLLKVQSITGLGKLIRLLFNIGGNIYSKMQNLTGILQAPTWPGAKALPRSFHSTDLFVNLVNDVTVWEGW